MTTASGDDVRSFQPTTLPNLQGYVATVIVASTTVASLVASHAGSGAVLLTLTLAVGMLFRTPYTVAIWTALALLASCAVALSLRGEMLAERLGDEVYFALVIGCVWAIWDMAAERWRWRMPAILLHERFAAKGFYRRAAAPVVAFVLLAFGVYAAAGIALELIGVLLIALSAIGLAFGTTWRVAAWSALALAALAGLQFIAHNYLFAFQASALTVGALLTAALWFGWGLLARQFDLTPLRAGRPRGTAARQEAARSSTAAQ